MIINILAYDKFLVCINLLVDMLENEIKKIRNKKLR